MGVSDLPLRPPQRQVGWRKRWAETNKTLHFHSAKAALRQNEGFFFFLAFFEIKTWEEDRTPAFLLAKGRPVAAFLFPPLQLGGRLCCFLKQDLQSTPTPGGPAAHHGLVGGTGQDGPPRQGVRDVGWGGRGGGEALTQSPPRRPTQLCSCNPAAQREWSRLGSLGATGRLVRSVQG